MKKLIGIILLTTWFLSCTDEMEKEKKSYTNHSVKSNMKKIFFCLFLLIAVSHNNSMGQDDRSTNDDPKTIKKEVKNEEGTAYELIITLPDNYNPQKTYKVLYYLDGWWLSELVTV